jgi:hypothetical protein
MSQTFKQKQQSNESEFIKVAVKSDFITVAAKASSSKIILSDSGHEAAESELLTAAVM